MPIAQIDFDRQASLHRDIIDAIKHSLPDVGLIHPVALRPSDDPLSCRYWLLAGRHRIAAAEEAGWTTIPAMIFRGITDLEARLVTICENAARSALPPAEFFAAVNEWNQLHRVKYPHGQSGGKATARRRAALAAGEAYAAEPSTSFVSRLGAAMSCSNSTAKRTMRIARMLESLAPDDKAHLLSLGEDFRPTSDQLQNIAKLAAVERSQVINLVRAGMPWPDAMEMVVHEHLERGTKNFQEPRGNHPDPQAWIEQFRPDLAAILAANPLLAADVNFFLEFTKVRRQVQRRLLKLLAKYRAVENGPAWRVVLSAATLNPPTLWDLCGGCAGEGCAKCAGAGYHPSYEPLPRPS